MHVKKKLKKVLVHYLKKKKKKKLYLDKKLLEMKCAMFCSTASECWQGK